MSQGTCTQLNVFPGLAALFVLQGRCGGGHDGATGCRSRFVLRFLCHRGGVVEAMRVRPAASLTCFQECHQGGQVIAVDRPMQGHEAV